MKRRVVMGIDLYMYMYVKRSRDKSFKSLRLKNSSLRSVSGNFEFFKVEQQLLNKIKESNDKP